MTVLKAATAQIVASMSNPIIRKNAALTSWRITRFIEISLLVESVPTRFASHNGRATGPWDQLSSTSIRNRDNALSILACCHDQCIRLASPQDVASGVVHRIPLPSTSGLHEPLLAYNGIGQKSMLLKWGGAESAHDAKAKYLKGNSSS